MYRRIIGTLAAPPPPPPAPAYYPGVLQGHANPIFYHGSDPGDANHYRLHTDRADAATRCIKHMPNKKFPLLLGLWAQWTRGLPVWLFGAPGRVEASIAYKYGEVQLYAGGFFWGYRYRKVCLTLNETNYGFATNGDNLTPHWSPASLRIKTIDWKNTPEGA